MTQENMADLYRNIVVGFSEKRKAWHFNPDNADSVRNHIEGPLSHEIIMDRVFNYTVDEQPIYLFDRESGTFMVIDDRKAMVRSDNKATLGVFKGGYKGHDFELTLLKQLDNLVGQGVGYSTAGNLKGGAVGFVQLELPDNFDTKEGVSFRPNLGAATSFDGSLATIYKRSFTVWVCDNTLSAGLAEDGQQYKVKHSKYSQLKLNSAQQALDLIVTTAEQASNEITKLCQWEVSDKQFNDFLKKLSPIPEIKEGDSTRGRALAITKVEKLVELYTKDERAAPWRGTAFGVLQATNTYNHHEANIRGGVSRQVRNFENFFSGKSEAQDNDVLAMLAKVCEREYA